MSERKRVDLVDGIWYERGTWWVQLEKRYAEGRGALAVRVRRFPGTRAGWGEMMEFLATYSYAELARAGVGACQIHGGECQTCPLLDGCASLT